MTRAARRQVISICIAASILTYDASAADDTLLVRHGDYHLTKPIRSWTALRENRVVMQRFDYSCGAAALATLLRYYFDENIDERSVLTALRAALSAEDFADREENGLSLLDMRNFAVKMGYQAVGVRLKYANISKLKVPILIHMESDNYKHFVVLKGVRGDRVFLADPSLGNIRVPIERFAQDWTGVALVLGKAGFSNLSDHPPELSDQLPIEDELLAAHRALVTPRSPGAIRALP